MTDSLISPFEVTKTILGVRNELISFTKLQHNPLLETTLNTKYGVQQNVEPASKPSLGYFGIGINGCYNVDDGNLRTPYIPSMEDMDLYTHIPFRCVPVDEDISSSERLNYRLRVRQTINGSDFWCYYLKLITFTDTDVLITQTDATTQEEVAYTLDANNLNPTPIKTSTTGTATAEGTEINVTTNCTLNILGSEVLEYISAKYNDPRRANISEIGIYSGVDAVVTGLDYNNNSFNYTEAIYAQLAIHFTCNGFPFLSSAATKALNLRLGKSNVLLI